MSGETATETTSASTPEVPKAEGGGEGGPAVVEEKKDESAGSTADATVSESEGETTTEEKKDDNNSAAEDSDTNTNTDTNNPQLEPTEEKQEVEDESADSSAKKEESESADTGTPGVVAAASGETADTETPPKLEHSFQPGDHVIRWEMLPIVWPIQVHGIVLEVNEYCVQICDFGLTAEMRQDESEKEVEENLDENAKKKHPRLQEAWDRVKPPDNRKKERITVHIITTQDEIKPWKKVHYGRGLFGMGNKDNAGEEGGEDGAEGEGGAANGGTPKKGAVIKQRVGNWWKRGLENIQHRREARQAARQQREKEAAATAAAAGGTTTAEAVAADAGDDKTEQSEASEVFSVKSATFEEESNNTDTNEQQPPPESPTKATAAVRRDSHNSSPTKNPKFLKGDFAAYHQEDQQQANGDTSDNSNSTMTKTTSDPSLSGKDTTKEQKNEKNKLPESDPPKLVLARTRLLLEQGENILPPYHPFKSNSECIAVFCKTGYWRTLQASVFLHSTAIGNAKSSMAMTLGVAASVPLLAPAVALAGAAMVGAPYIILNQSHKTWQQTTIQLNEEFWKQAPNEVFVECIEHWSNLADDSDDKEGSNNSEENTESPPPADKEGEGEEKKPPSQRFVSV